MLPFVPLRIDSGEDPRKLNSSFHPAETDVNLTKTLAVITALTYSKVVAAIEEAESPLKEFAREVHKRGPPEFGDAAGIKSTYRNPCLSVEGPGCKTTLDKVNRKYATAKEEGKIYNPVNDWDITTHKDMAQVSRDVLYDVAWDGDVLDSLGKKKHAVKSKAYIGYVVGQYDPKDVRFVPGHLFLAVEPPWYPASDDRPNPSPIPLRKVGLYGFFPNWSDDVRALFEKQSQDVRHGSLGDVALEFHLGDPSAIDVAHFMRSQKWMGQAVPEGNNAAEMQIVKSFDVDRDTIGMLREAIASSGKKINPHTKQPYENIYMIDKIKEFKSVRFNIYAALFQPMLALQNAWWFYRQPSLIGNCATVIQELFKEDIASDIVCPLGVPKWCAAPESSSSLFAALLQLLGLAKNAKAKIDEARTLQGPGHLPFSGADGCGFGKQL